MVTTINKNVLAVIANIQQSIKKSPTGVSFINIKNYTNTSGEVADHLCNIGISYESAKAKDIETLQNLDVTKIESKFDKLLLLSAVTELLNGLTKPNENISKGQIDAYTHIIGGVKVHNETGEVYIYAYRQNKTVKVEGEYKAVNSKPLTLAKNYIKKEYLRTGKFTQYKLSEIGNIKVNGETLEIG